MFCWSCGHENPDTQKFCGECGKSLFKPEKVVREFPLNNASRPEVPEASHETFSESSEVAKSAEPVNPTVSPPVASAAPPPEPMGRMLTPPRPAVNPLVEESRVIHEDPIAEAKAASPAPPTPIRDRIPNRITGPSFLGLSDEAPAPGDEQSYYLLDDEPEKSSSWGGYVLLALLVVVSLLVIRNWQDVRAVASDYTQRLGLSDAPKHPAGPQRVTGGNDASQITPDAAQEEGKSTTPSEQTPAKSEISKKAETPQQTAKLEKPQTDEPPAAEPLKDSESADTSSAKPAPAKTAAPTAPVDNSQLEEAQKYLQGRGVPQDCNRGVDLLRSAAKQPNAKARVQMAALYSSGHCVTEDPVQAYTWFSRAQEVEPRNKLIERNLDMLWARMSDQERQKVLR